MTDEERRRLNGAIWHARESIVCAAAGENENADFHLSASREFLHLLKPGAEKGATTPDAVLYRCSEISDAAGLVVA